MPLVIEKNVPMYQTRGRPPSDEHIALLNMQIDDSFVSLKRRETLYQIARDMGVKVSILPEGENGNEGWRVWKRSGKMPVAKRIRIKKPMPQGHAHAKRLAKRRARGKS